MPSNVQVIGPWRGTLLNDRMRVRLLFPDYQNADSSVPYVEVDSLEYSASYPWPPMQIGVPLTRRNMSEIADEPTNWLVDASLPRFASAAAAALSLAAVVVATLVNL